MDPEAKRNLNSGANRMAAAEPQPIEDPDSNPLEPVRYGVVAVVPREGRLLVIRRSEFVLAPRAICFPGGGIEPGESEPQALVREIQEELGVDIVPGRCLWRSVTAWRIALAWWLASLPPDAKLVPNAAEVEAVHWLGAEAIRAHPDLLQGNIGFLDALVNGQVELV